MNLSENTHHLKLSSCYMHRCDHACFLPKWETIYLQRRIELVVKMAIQIYRGGERESENVREATCLCCNQKCTNSIYREGGTKTFMGCVIEFGQDKRCSETQVSLYLFTCFRNMYTKNVCLNRSLLSLEMGFCFCHRSMGMFVHIYIYIRLEVESVKESLEREYFHVCSCRWFSIL
jgi:hypothetical protein